MQRLKPLFLRQMTWTSFTKATMRGRCSSTSKWVTTTERKDTKRLRMRLPLIIRLSHGYWYLLLHIYLHIYHCQPEETDEDRAAHENLKKSKPSERSVVAMQAKYKVQVQVQAKYKVAENISIFCVDLTKNQPLIWPKNNLWSVICLTKTLRSDQELPCSRTRSSRARKSCSSPMALMQLSRATACIFSGDSEPLLDDEWFCWMKTIWIQSSAKARL